jgi:branched-chain amino acid transport system substrate-binding protein
MTLSVAVFAQSADNAQKKETVKVGAIFPLTGNWEMVGSQLKDGVLMRLKEQNKKTARFNYEVIMEDDGQGPKSENLAYLKLVNVDQCSVILNDSGNLLAPLAARDKRFFFSLSWDDSAAKDSLAFIHCTPVAPQVRLLSDTLSGLSIRRVAVLCLIQKGFLSMEKNFSEDAPKVGIKTRTIKFIPGERDFRSVLLKFSDFHPDAYLILAGDPEFQIIIRRIREIDKKTPITAVEGFSYLGDLSEYNGSFFVAGNQATEEFRKKFLVEAGSKGIGFSGNTYDMLDLVIHAYETAGAKLGRKPTTAEASEVLYSLKDYPGAIGLLTMGSNRVIQSPAVLKYIQNGKADIISIEELKNKLGR